MLFDLIDNKKDSLIYVYKLIIAFFDNKVSIKELDQQEIYEILSVYVFIRTYVENINEKIKSIFIEEVIQERSAFDEYDKENGYDNLDNANQMSICDNYLNILNSLFKFSISECKNSLKENLDTDIMDLLDYVEFCINNKEENQEEYSEINE